MERDIKTASEKGKPSSTRTGVEMPESLNRFAYWAQRDAGGTTGRSYKSDCLSCTNGGTGDCVACRG